jgi:hypothetical protein
VVNLITRCVNTDVYGIEWQWIMNWKEFGTREFWPHFRYYPGMEGLSKNHEKPQLRKPVSCRGIETRTSQV